MDAETEQVLTAAQPAKASKQYSSETNHIGLNSGIGYFFICFILTSTKLNCAVTHLLFNYTFQKLPVLHWQG